MNRLLIHTVASRWARLGAMLNLEMAAETPDLERLILDTARVAPDNSRLFILSASWLATYGDNVEVKRLVRLIEDELEMEYRPTLGFLLEWAARNGASIGSRFEAAVEACGCASEAGPLLEIERRNSSLSRLSEGRASALSRKWGRWMADFDVKIDALRPTKWIAEQNPGLGQVKVTSPPASIRRTA